MEFKLPVRPKISNKGTFGKVLNIAGSRNYSGAAFLSSVSDIGKSYNTNTLTCLYNDIFIY